MTKIVVIDGQGGKLGALITARLKSQAGRISVYAIGTNSAAAQAMLKAGADHAATGENPVIVNCRDADFIVGPIGIISADSLLGEITPAMAQAVGQSRARKVLLPVNRCNVYIAGMSDLPVAELIDDAARYILEHDKRIAF